MTNKPIIDTTQSYPACLLALRNRDYKEAIVGFKNLLKYQAEPFRSFWGLITAYSCIGEYKKVVDLCEQHEDYLYNDSFDSKREVRLLTSLLMQETALLKKNYRATMTSYFFLQKMKDIFKAYEQDSKNPIYQILISYWYCVLGLKSENTEDAFLKVLYYDFIDDEFRWKLLEKMSLEKKELLEDINLARKFKKIARYIDGGYINLLLYVSLISEDLSISRDKIEIQRFNGVEISNEVMWNYLDLVNDKNEIDDLAVNFAKQLFSRGWIDQIIANIFFYASENLNIYNVENELKALEFFGLKSSNK